MLFKKHACGYLSFPSSAHVVLVFAWTSYFSLILGINKCFPVAHTGMLRLDMHLNFSFSLLLTQNYSYLYLIS